MYGKIRCLCDISALLGSGGRGVTTRYNHFVPIPARDPTLLYLQFLSRQTGSAFLKEVDHMYRQPLLVRARPRAFREDIHQIQFVWLEKRSCHTRHSLIVEKCMASNVLICDRTRGKSFFYHATETMRPGQILFKPPRCY